jgi:hypothetical protein
VGDIDGGHADSPLKFPDLDTDMLPDLSIEVAQWLIHEQNGSITRDGAGHRDALTLTAAQLGRTPHQELTNPQHPCHLADTSLDIGPCHPAQLHVVADVLPNAEMRVERIILEHHTDIAPARINIIDFAATDLDLPGIDLLEPGNGAQKRRLARAGRSEQHQELAILGRDRNVRERKMGHLAPEALADISHDHLNHRRPTLPHRA